MARATWRARGDEGRHRILSEATTNWINVPKSPNASTCWWRIRSANQLSSGNTGMRDRSQQPLDG